MSELPKGWVELPLEHVASWGSGGTPKRSEPSYYGGDVPWVKTGDLGPRYLKEASEYISQLGLEKSSAKLFPKGSVAIAMYGATIGKTSTLDFEASTNQACAVGNPIDGVILTDFLYYFLTSEKQNFIKKGKGGAQPNISQQLIKAHEIQLPSLAEQKRIVEKLDEVLAQVDTIKARLDGIPALLKRFRQSVLASATSGEISKNWRELNSPSLSCKNDVVKKVFTEWCKSKEAEFSRKDKIPKNDKWKEKFPELDFGENPVSCWHAINLASVAEVIDPNPSHRMPKYVDDGFPFISSENIVNLSCIDFVKGKKIQGEELEKQKTRYEVRDGTFAFTRIGTIGKSVLLPVPHNYGVSHAMAIVNPFQSLIDSRFLILSMNCKSILSQAHEGVQSVGVPDLGIGKMKSFIIPLPSIDEQKEIVRLVDQYFAFADTIEAQVKKAQARVDNLTQSILAKAFRGELVAQDPNDEPADKLLERIAAARKEAEALTKAAKKAGASKEKANKAAVKG